MLAPLSIEEAARRIGTYKWVEMRLFEILGGWVSTVSEPQVKMLLGEQCHHHAWHAELWHHRLPELREMNAEHLTGPANNEVAACLEAVSHAESTIERLVGVFRVLTPHSISTYSAHLDATSAVTDGPTIRSLQLVLTDQNADWRSGERILQTLLRTSDDVAVAAHHQAKVETMLIAAGGIAGINSGREPESRGSVER
jgi:hypothetical protein